MFKHLRHLRNPKVRASTTSSLDAATHLPNSGLTFVDNSQGASAAVAELSQTLDTALEQTDWDGNVPAALAAQLSLLDGEAANYTNATFHNPSTVDSTEWKGSLNDVEVVGAAWDCAAAVYGRETLPPHSRFDVEEINYSPPSTTGVSRATTYRIVRAKYDGNPLFPMLVVAVRGTVMKSMKDNIVNANSRGQSADHLVPRDMQLSMEAHAGFLAAAEVLVAKTAQNIDGMSRHAPIKHVVFTGHSAGGAVSSLLFLRFLTHAAVEYPDLRFSSITFGSPPVVRPDIAPSLPRGDNCGLTLAIVNEYDLVPRTDASYIRSLVDLYRSIYHLHPIEGEGSQQSLNVQALKNSSTWSSDATVPRSWFLPSPDFWHVGDIILLKLELPCADNGARNGMNGTLALRAFKVGPDEFAKFLFCRISVHARVCYTDRVETLMRNTLGHHQ